MRVFLVLVVVVPLVLVQGCSRLSNKAFERTLPSPTVPIPDSNVQARLTTFDAAAAGEAKSGILTRPYASGGADGSGAGNGCVFTLMGQVQKNVKVTLKAGPGCSAELNGGAKGNKPDTSLEEEPVREVLVPSEPPTDSEPTLPSLLFGNGS